MCKADNINNTEISNTNKIIKVNKWYFVKIEIKIIVSI